MQKNKKSWQIKLGIFLMVFSGVFFAMTLIIPLLGLPARTTVIAATTSVFALLEFFVTCLASRSNGGLVYRIPK